jgi:hypothetical protein
MLAVNAIGAVDSLMVWARASIAIGAATPAAEAASDSSRLSHGCSVPI